MKYESLNLDRVISDKHKNIKAFCAVHKNLQTIDHAKLQGKRKREHFMFSDR